MGNTDHPAPRVQLLEEGPRTAERAPEGPGGLEWVVLGAGRPGPAPAIPAHPSPTHHSLRSGPGPCRALVGGWAPRSKRARLRSYFYKVSQNDEVSPKYLEKACHAPYFQNGLKNSPLEIPGFPYLLAFSPKELMVLFWPRVEVYGQNDEVSTVCTCTRRGRTYPHGQRSKLLLLTAPHVLSASVELTVSLTFSMTPFITRN